MMQTTKYQIFVSSTYEDLREAREQVIKAVLEMGHIPVGMEMFSAADEEQWKIITRQIDQSDYYVAIIAHRYGSVVDGVSYTEKEYDYAVQQGIPVIGFVVDNSAPWPSKFIEADNKKKRALELFKAKAKLKPVGFWSSHEDLYGKVSIALMKLMNTNPRPGWVRTSEVAGPEVLTELTRLSKENADLRNQIAELGQGQDTKHLAQGDDEVEVSVTHDLNGSIETFKTTWNELFNVVGQTSLHYPTENNIKSSIEKFITARIGKLPSPLEKELNIPEPSYQFTDVEDFNRIKIQFMALNLIEIQRGNMGGSMNLVLTQWLLTSYGKRVLADLIAIRRISPEEQMTSEHNMPLPAR